MEDTRLAGYSVRSLKNMSIVGGAYQLPSMKIVSPEGETAYEVRCEQKWEERNLNYVCFWKPELPSQEAASLVLHGFDDAPLSGLYLVANQRYEIRGFRNEGFLERGIYTSRYVVLSEDQQEILHIHQGRSDRPEVWIDSATTLQVARYLMPLALTLVVNQDLRNKEHREHFPNEELPIAVFIPNGNRLAPEIEAEPSEVPELARHIMHAKQLSELGAPHSAKALTQLLGRVATIEAPRPEWSGMKIYGALLGGIDFAIGGEMLDGNDGNDILLAPTVTGQLGVEVYPGLAPFAEAEFGTTGLSPDAVQDVGTENIVRSSRLRFGLGIEYRLVDDEALALALGFVTSMRLLDAKQDFGREEVRLRYVGFELSPRFGIRYKLRNWMGRSSVEIVLDGRVSHVVWSSSVNATEGVRDNVRLAFTNAIRDDDTWHVGAVGGLRFGF